MAGWGAEEGMAIAFMGHLPRSQASVKRLPGSPNRTPASSLQARKQMPARELTGPQLTSHEASLGFRLRSVWLWDPG